MIFDSAQCGGWEQVLSVMWMDIHWIFSISWVDILNVWEFSMLWVGTSFECNMDGYPLDILNVVGGYS